ncbi:hypothetical protein pipiens_016047 [Culex pipiens pipiens]|uniref:Uncharacterized protein n=1 Tax=Culex pipiens pipiens TaxID=38569 RepID=A0ABD1CNY5_CULPP
MRASTTSIHRRDPEHNYCQIATGMGFLAHNMGPVGFGSSESASGKCHRSRCHGLALIENVKADDRTTVAKTSVPEYRAPSRVMSPGTEP